MTTPAEAAHAVECDLIRIRRHLHQHPELRWEEEGTLAFIRNEIEETPPENGASVIIHDHYTGGLVVDLTTDPSRPRELFRADVDALPIQEATGLPFASNRDGLMHACGHDIHAAMLLAAYLAIARGLLAARRNLRFVFQRAEENPHTESGGARLVSEGVTEGVSRVYGLHAWSTSEAGVFFGRAGPMMANGDRMRVRIKCTGGHVSQPDMGSNAIDIANNICGDLRGFDTRALGPSAPSSLVPAMLHAGNSSNTRPSEADMWFAVRTYLDQAEREEWHRKLKSRVEATVSAYEDASVEVSSVLAHPCLVNDAESFKYVSRLLSSAGEVVRTQEPVLGGEDFAHYLRASKGSYWLLGAHKQGAGRHHTPTFSADESVFWKGTHMWLLLAAAEEGE